MRDYSESTIDAQPWYPLAGGHLQRGTVPSHGATLLRGKRIMISGLEIKKICRPVAPKIGALASENLKYM